MADAGGGGMRWVKYGCFGCAGLTLIVVLLIGGLVGAVFVSTEQPQVEERVLTHEVPTAASGGSAPTPLPAGAGKVTLDLSGAEFEVLPGDPGEPLRVEASFDTNAYAMEEKFEDFEGGRWEYTFRFRRKGSGALAYLRQMFSGSEPDIRVFLPPDSPIELDLSASQGAARVELGGLWLTEANVHASMGALVLDIDEPLRQPMDRLSIDVSMGGGRLRRLGNASPRELVIDLSMGGMEMDLRGEWKNDSEVTVIARRSGGQLSLPRDVRVEGLEAGRMPGNLEPEIQLPTLRFTSATVLDDVDVSH